MSTAGALKKRDRSEHGLCVAIRQPFAAADAAHTGPAPNPMQVWI